MKRPGKPEGQYYLSHQTLDTDHGVILGVTVTPGDVHDSVPYLDRSASGVYWEYWADRGGPLPHQAD